MKEGNFELTSGEANSIRNRILENICELPQQSKEHMATYGERPIWHEMYSMGIISKNQQDALISTMGQTVGELFKAFYQGNRQNPAILRTSGIGFRTYRDIRDFIRLSYGFEPDLPAFEEHTFKDEDIELDIDGLDKQLSNYFRDPGATGSAKR